MTQHPQADILRAIADGKQIQTAIDSEHGGWKDIRPDEALHFITNRIAKLRIKPATITINGTELPKPVPNADEPPEQFCFTLYGEERKAFWFNTREDRDAVYAKLVEVLGS